MFFKTIYAVCVRTYIDGGAPGYYSVAMCETKEDAEIVKTFVNSCLKTINSTPENVRRHKDAKMLIDSIVEWNDIKFGYDEGVDSETSWIQEIKIVTAGNGAGLPTKLNHLLRDHRRRLKENAKEKSQ